MTVLLSYKGALSYEIIAKMGHHIRKNLGKRPKLCRKVFAVFIELAQNVFNYSSEKNILAKESPVGNLKLYEQSDYYTLAVGNLVSIKQKDALEKYCKKINKLSPEELRKERIEKPNSVSQINKKGAGIGLLKVILFAEAPLIFDAYQVNKDFFFIILSTKITKHQ